MMEVNSVNWCTRKTNSARIDVGRGGNNETQVVDMSEERDAALKRLKPWQTRRNWNTVHKSWYIILEKELSRLVVDLPVSGMLPLSPSVLNVVQPPQTLRVPQDELSHCSFKRSQLWRPSGSGWPLETSLGRGSRHVPLGGEPEEDSGHTGRLCLLAGLGVLQNPPRSAGGSV